MSALRPGDKVYAYCATCGRQTSHTVVDKYGSTVCNESHKDPDVKPAEPRPSN